MIVSYRCDYSNILDLNFVDTIFKNGIDKTIATNSGG